MKEQFLAGWGVTLDGKQHCHSFIETHITTKEICFALGSYIHLVYDERELLKEAKLYLEKNQEVLPIKEGDIDRINKLKCGIGKLNYKYYESHVLYDFVEDINGLHSIGGEAPIDFRIPTEYGLSSFQYVGKISNQDAIFEWLPFDLHIIFPLYYQIDEVVLDYSNPTAPQILNIEDFENKEAVCDSLRENSEIVFKQKHFSIKNISPTDFAQRNEVWGFTGLPMWLQYPDIPVCPQSGKTMRFVCQLTCYTKLDIEKAANIKLEKSENELLHEGFLHIGDLYIFFEPETKIACFINQYT